MAERTDRARTRIFVLFDPTAVTPLASRLVDALRQRFSDNRVITAQDVIGIDVQVREMEFDRALDSCIVLLVLVGDDQLAWAGSAASAHDVGSAVHRTLVRALESEHITTIPVLLDKALMPAAGALPVDIERFAALRSVNVNDLGCDADVDTLVLRVDQEIEMLEMIKRGRAVLAAGDPAAALDIIEGILSRNPDHEAALELRLRAQSALQVAEQRRAQAERRRAEKEARAAQEQTGAIRIGSVREVSPPSQALMVDENVQFTVFRRSAIQPEHWYPMLVFAHLSERRPDAPEDEPDPIAEVQAQASQVLGDAIPDFRTATEDSLYPVTREGELRFVPRIAGVTFNPRERRFLWTESVHREDFRMRADASMDGRTVRGTVSIYTGSLLLADVQVSIKVHRHAKNAGPEQTHARPYRRIFASYSHRDTHIVEEFESHATATGDRYLRDVVTLRAGEEWNQRLRDMIKQADVFQLFWSWNALASPMVREEWQHALSLNRSNFVRPVYWEEPFPERANLPPPQLRRLHFQRVYPRAVAETSQAAGHVRAATNIADSDTLRFPVPWPAPSAPQREPQTTAPPTNPLPAPSAFPSMRFVRHGSMVAVCLVAVGLYWGLSRPTGPNPVQPPHVESAPPSPTGGGAATPAPPPSVDLPNTSPTTPIAKPSIPTGGAQPAPVKRGGGALARGGLPSTGAQSSAPNVSSAIGSTIREYEIAWSMQDRGRLQRVWLMTPEQGHELDQIFTSAETIQVRARVMGISMASDTRATVHVQETREIVGRGRGRPRAQTRSRLFQLEKRGSDWIIVAIDPDR